jgi:MerR family transcriptional regulator, thiopeptide resistance regulator
LRELGLAHEPSVDELLDLILEITKMDQYYTPEQQDEIRNRGQALGAEGLRKAETDWQELMASVQKEMDAGTDPSEPRVRALAARWQSLVQAFTGGNPGIAQSLGKMWQQETTIHGIDTANMRAMMSYIGKAGGKEGK